MLVLDSTLTFLFYHPSYFPWKLLHSEHTSHLFMMEEQIKPHQALDVSLQMWVLDYLKPKYFH